MKKFLSFILIITMLSTLFVNAKAVNKAEVDDNYRYIVYIIDEKVYHLDAQQIKSANTTEGVVICLPETYKNKLINITGEGCPDVHHSTLGFERYITDEITFEFFAESEERGKCNYKIIFKLTDSTEDINADHILASGESFLFAGYYLESIGNVFLNKSQIAELERNHYINIEIDNIENGESFAGFCKMKKNSVSAAWSTNYNKYSITEFCISVQDENYEDLTEYRIYINYEEYKTSFLASYLQSLADKGTSEFFLKIADAFNKFLFNFINRF